MAETISDGTLAWLLDSDPSIKWQVERDLLGAPENVWAATKKLVGTQGFGANLLALQDSDGQWAGGAYFPGRPEPRALNHEDDAQGQPYIATTWSLNQLREWGVDATLLGDTAARLERASRWEYENLPYWQGEVDCCINTFTLANGAWLGHDVSGLATWFLEHQMADGGWNCEWVEGSTRSSFHSTLNSLIGVLDYEIRTGRNRELTAARRRAEAYLLTRELMYRNGTADLFDPWANRFVSPPRWRYSVLRAADYFRSAALFDGTLPDSRLSKAIAEIRSQMTPNGRWLNAGPEKGSVWFETDAPMGQESKFLTLSALRVLTWWDAAVG